MPNPVRPAVSSRFILTVCLFTQAISRHLSWNRIGHSHIRQFLQNFVVTKGAGEVHVLMILDRSIAPITHSIMRLSRQNASGPAIGLGASDSPLGLLFCAAPGANEQQ